MFNFMVTSDGGLTTAGYAIAIIAGIVLFLAAIYPIVYNYSYLLAEGIITVIVISIPAVSKALAQVKKAAIQ